MERVAKKRGVYTEALNPYFGYYYTIKKSLRKTSTKYQKMELVDTDEFGKVLLLDDITQVVEKNHFMYHEPMVHPALCAHPDPQNILVVGGGDGGILGEVLKYPTVKRVELAELDEGVIRFSRKYLHFLCKFSQSDEYSSLFRFFSGNCCNQTIIDLFLFLMLKCSIFWKGES